MPVSSGEVLNDPDRKPRQGGTGSEIAQVWHWLASGFWELVPCTWVAVISWPKKWIKRPQWLWIGWGISARSCQNRCQNLLDVPSGVAIDESSPHLAEGEVVFLRPYLTIPHVELKFNPGAVPGRDDGVIETTETGFKWWVPKSATGDWIANGRMESDSK